MCGLPPLRPDARGLVALSTFATVAFVAPPAAPTPNAMCVQMPQVPAALQAPSCDWQKQMRNESAPTRRSGIWCGLVRLRFWLTYAMAHLRHPMAMRRQLLARSSFAATVLFGETALPTASADEVCRLLLASLGSPSSCFFFSLSISQRRRKIESNASFLG